MQVGSWHLINIIALIFKFPLFHMSICRVL